MNQHAERISTAGPVSYRSVGDLCIPPAAAERIAPVSVGAIKLPDGPPFVLRWGGTAPALPVRSIRTARLRARFPQEDPPPWLATGPAHAPFDFCGHVRRLCADVVARCAELRHVDVSRLLFCVTQARTGRPHGLQARVTPLRFRRGALIRQRRGVAYQVQRYFHDGREMLYLVTFCLPRFLDQEFDDK